MEIKPFTDTEKLQFIELRHEGVGYYQALNKIKKDRRTNTAILNTPTKTIQTY